MRVFSFAHKLPSSGVRRRSGLWLVFFLAGHLPAAPVFLDLVPAGNERKPLRVLAGNKTEFVVTLTSSAVENPELSMDLLLVGGALAAPLLKGITPDLNRLDGPPSELQQFRFFVDIPEVKTEQAMVLRLRVRTAETGKWLWLPAMELTAIPRTWPQNLRRFTNRVRCVQLSGGTKLERLIKQAELELPVVDSPETNEGPEARVLLAEFSEEHEQSIAGGLGLWIVFKPGVAGGISLQRSGSQGRLYMLVDDGVFAVTDNEANGQDLLERALAMAETLLSTFIHPDSS